MKVTIPYIMTAIMALSCFCFTGAAQEDFANDSTITISPDSLHVHRNFMVNDYSLIGFQYGVSFNQTQFNPTMKQSALFNPEYFGITYTRYGKLFGYMPYFGFQVGIMYGHEGYKFKKDKITGVSENLDGATQAIMNVVEIPLLAQMHADFLHFKLMGNIGIYGGYRMKIERTGPSVDEVIRNNFKDTDIRFDYGLKGGVGFGLVFDPIEIHFQGMLKYSWSSLYEPDYYSRYYYRFAYPLDIVLTAGINFQLTRRSGKTNRQLKKEAYKQVFGNGSGKSSSEKKAE
jgi:hypothetical protein